MERFTCGDGVRLDLEDRAPVPIQVAPTGAEL